MNTTEPQPCTSDPGSLALASGHACSSIVSALRTLNVADVTRVQTLFAPSVVVQDHRVEPETPFHDVTSLLDALARHGVDRFNVRLLAVRGQHVALVRLRFDRAQRPVSDTLVVAEADAQERLVKILVYDQTDLARAAAELAVLFGPSLDPARRAAFDVATAFGNAIVVRDHATVARVTSDELVYVDYRDEQTVEAERLATLSVVTGILDDDPQIVDFAPELYLITDKGLVASRAMAELHGVGVAEIDISLILVENGKVSRIEMYNESDLDRAMAKLRLLSDSTPSG